MFGRALPWSRGRPVKADEAQEMTSRDALDTPGHEVTLPTGTVTFLFTDIEGSTTELFGLSIL